MLKKQALKWLTWLKTAGLYYLLVALTVFFGAFLAYSLVGSDDQPEPEPNSAGSDQTGHQTQPAAGHNTGSSQTRPEPDPAQPDQPPAVVEPDQAPAPVKNRTPTPVVKTPPTADPGQPPEDPADPVSPPEPVANVAVTDPAVVCGFGPGRDCHLSFGLVNLTSETMVFNNGCLVQAALIDDLGRHHQEMGGACTQAIVHLEPGDRRGTGAYFAALEPPRVYQSAVISQAGNQINYQFDVTVSSR